ncbi:hypothetical protein [Spirochaeta isovalerica]|uniref:Uncharacterized protein n=1 Tax=Spirochaeta isovalerica TaxID=150 RepID=A0A841RFA1_9SPIO|nr:hypothetical protein [Spirochaeta isovalerica]MBB6481268.1 hypothetical protein [Spirochaeta isovalerica]
MECECLSQCPFFNDKMAEKPALANIMKKRYCLDDFNSCARHKIFLAKGKSAVPPNLYPNQIEEAEKILAELK